MKGVAKLMSYYVQNKSSDGKPDCFGDDNEYVETSSGCRGCGFRLECAKQIEQKARQPMSYYRPRAAATAPTTATTQAGVAYRPAVPAATVPRSNVIRASEVDFNFNKPILKQFTTYLTYDIAQVTTERVHSLIVAAREDYKQRVMGDEE